MATRRQEDRDSDLTLNRASGERHPMVASTVCLCAAGVGELLHDSALIRNYYVTLLR